MVQGYEDYFDKPVIITVATTGGRHGKETNPNIPLTPEAIAEDVRKCEEAGASIVHLHARDEDGEQTKDPARYQEIRRRIDEYCDEILVNFTTGEAFSFPPEERIRPVVETDPRPEFASLDMGPLNVGKSATAPSTRETIEAFAESMQESGVKPELELFNPGQLSEVDNLIGQGLLEPPYYCNVIFGMQTGTVPHPRNLINFVDNLPDQAEWTCMAIGKHQLPLTTMGLLLGGHVRVGLEDNVYYRKGELADSNAQLVRRARRLAEELERPVATPAETREIFNLKA